VFSRVAHVGLAITWLRAFYAPAQSACTLPLSKAEACINAAKELSEFGECIAISGNMGSMGEISALVKELTERETSIDVLVNNAGTG
jgi:NAD(P)-dependent dehydrogenase (short-subunit alcohol dehydrogenase family)